MIAKTRIHDSDYTYTIPYVDLFFSPSLLSMPLEYPVCAESSICLTQPVFFRCHRAVIVGWLD